MPACSAVGCTNRPGKKIQGISFHRFPKDHVLRAAWVVACRRKDWFPTSVSILCSEHFSEDLIDRTSKGSVRLRENAIPNIFNGYSPQVQNIPVKELSALECLASTAAMTNFNDDEALSCDESASETTNETDEIEETVYLNYPDHETSAEYVPPVLPQEECESPEKQLPSTATSSYKEVVHLSHESMSKTPAKWNVINSKVCLTPPVNQSSMKKRPPIYITKKWNPSKNRFAYTAATSPINNEVIELSDENMSETSSENDVMETVNFSNSPVNESSVENMSPVRIPVVESDSEEYPNDDLEKKYLKRKLEQSKQKLLMYRKKIKTLQQQNRRWKKQLEETKRSLKVLQMATKSIFSD